MEVPSLACVVTTRRGAGSCVEGADGEAIFTY